MARHNDIAIEGASILFPNFTGEKTEKNRTGAKGFNVEIFDEEMAKQLFAEGWNVKPQKQYNPEDPLKWMLPVAIDFSKPDQYPCTVWMYSNGVPTQLDETTIATLQGANIENLDIVIRPGSYRTDAGEWKIKAWLSVMHAVVVKDADRFAAKYASFHKPDEEPIPFN